jgi:hypothetical protein
VFSKIKKALQAKEARASEISPGILVLEPNCCPQITFQISRHFLGREELGEELSQLGLS